MSKIIRRKKEKAVLKEVAATFLCCKTQQTGDAVQLIYEKLL